MTKAKFLLNDLEDLSELWVMDYGLIETEFNSKCVHFTSYLAS